MKRFLVAAAFCFLWTLRGAEAVFSGPQVGEKATPFQVLELWGPAAGSNRDPMAEQTEAVALVFVNGIERSMLPLLRAIDEYGASRADRLGVEVVFLFADRVQGEQRVKAAANSIKLHSRVGLSLDGLEGPGNYGLNKECMMTIVASKDNVVTANFALVQPGIADAPKVIAALARACGDENPPPIEQFTGRRPNARGARGPQMQDRATRPSADLQPNQYDLDSEAGLRDAVRGLMAEVQLLRTELDELRGAKLPMAQGRQKETEPARDSFPGAVPEDPKLNALLRQMIRQTNDDETVDKLVAEMEAYIKGNEDLTKQAADGWVRVLHFGDRYGTSHARELGRAFLNKAGAKHEKPGE